MERAKILIDDRVSRIRIIETSYCDVPYYVLLGVGRFENGRVALDEIGHNYEDDLNPTDHGQTFNTWSYETDQPVSLMHYATWQKNDRAQFIAVKACCGASCGSASAR